MSKKNGHLSFFRNWLSVIGGISAIVFFVVIISLIGLETLFGHGNPYLQAVTFLILPSFLVGSIVLIFLGASMERRRRLRRGGVRRFPIIDFNDALHQRVAFIAIGLTTFFLLFSVFGTYRAYEFTESTTFCGLVCHQVMEPEHTAYQNSPHARVACVDCHIGSGADWYVRSKFSGLYQVYSSMVGKYSRPIETPIKNLRPAQETCETCHWPQAFFGAVEQVHDYYLPDEENTHWKARMLILVGGGGAVGQGSRHGIHWHMNVNNKVEYVAEDEEREVIPWVKQTDASGKEIVYIAEESEYSAETRPEGELRKMDCVDCHNRPSHVYKTPSRAVNQAMRDGHLSPELPYLKREAVEVLIGEYETNEQAYEEIRRRLNVFYNENYPEIVEAKPELLEKAIEGTKRIYSENFFPRMKVSWKAYPDHIGHMNFNGCFRCHDGLHRSEEGRVITNDCNSCHLIISQGPSEELQSSVDGLEFRHPEDIAEMWRDMNCSECHDGSIA